MGACPNGEATTARDIVASFGDFLGGRPRSSERRLQNARDEALQLMENEAAGLGADAVIGIDLAFQTLGPQGSLIIVSAAGTAVRFGAGAGAALALRRA